LEGQTSRQFSSWFSGESISPDSIFCFELEEKDGVDEEEEGGAKPI
jgi:hypothetical protein